MNREQKERLHYVVPRCTVVLMQEDSLLQAVSGQHEHIGQGGTLGNAKRYNDEEWEEEPPIVQPFPIEGSSHSLWDE